MSAQIPFSPLEKMSDIRPTDLPAERDARNLEQAAIERTILLASFFNCSEARRPWGDQETAEGPIEVLRNNKFAIEYV